MESLLLFREVKGMKNMLTLGMKSLLMLIMESLQLTMAIETFLRVTMRKVY